MATPLGTIPPLLNSSEAKAIIEKQISSLLKKKYAFDENYYNTCLINDIIYNEKSHIVAIFKNFLIVDDDSEFLKRFYTKKESSVRLPKFFEYYDTYSKIFPNYTILTESKYIFKNIHKKQKMIDLQQENKSTDSKEKDNDKKPLGENRTGEVFSTDVYNSIVNDHDDIAVLFNIKRDYNDNNNDDINEDKDIMKINALIDMIAIKVKKINANHKMNPKLKTNTFDYWSSSLSSTKKPLLTPRLESSKQPNILTKLIPRENSEAISRFIQQELLINKKRTIYNKINEHTVKMIQNNGNSILKLPNSSRSNSINHQGHNSTANHHTIPIPRPIPATSISRPLTHRESSTNKIEDNDLITNIDTKITPLETERIRVNLRPIKEERESITKNIIISHIRANNRFFFQSKNIASQFNQNLKLGNGNREKLLSPQATTRRIINEKEVINNVNEMKAMNVNFHQEKENESEVLKKESNHLEQKDTKSKHSSSKEAGINTTRPKSRSNLSNQPSTKNNNHKQKQKPKQKAKPNHLVINVKKDVGLIPSSMAKSPMKKIVKGIEIKNFSKALGLLEMPLQNTNTDRLDNIKRNKVRIPV